MKYFYGFEEKGSMCLILVGFSKKISYSTTLEAINVWSLLGFYKQSYAYNAHSEHIVNLDLILLALISTLACFSSSLLPICQDSRTLLPL